MQCQVIANWTLRKKISESLIKIQNCSSRECIWKYSLRTAANLSRGKMDSWRALMSNDIPLFCEDVIPSLQWSHNKCDCVSNHQSYDCLLNRLFRRISNKTSKLRVTVLCEGNSPVTGEFPTQRDSDAENVSIWWRHHDPCPRLGDDLANLC